MDQAKDAGSKRNLCIAGQSHSRNVVDTRTAEKGLIQGILPTFHLTRHSRTCFQNIWFVNCRFVGLGVIKFRRLRPPIL